MNSSVIVSKQANDGFASLDTNLTPNLKGLDEVISFLQAKLDKKTNTNSDISGITGISDYQAALQCLVSIRENIKNNTVDKGFKTGVSSIDDLIGGFYKGTLNVLASRSGVGKTALACQIAYNNARDETHKRPIFFFSPDMSERQLNARYCASVAKANIEELGNLSNFQLNEIVNDMKNVGNKVTFFYGHFDLSIEEIRSELNSFIKDKGLAPGLIIIDSFLEMMLKKDEPIAPQYAYAAYEKIALELKAIAREYDLAVLVLTQVGRSQDGPNSLPHPENLRGGNGLYQVSDLTFFLHQQKYNNEERVVYVAKNHLGSLGQTTVHYDGPHYTFYD